MGGVAKAVGSVVKGVTGALDLSSNYQATAAPVTQQANLVGDIGNAQKQFQTNYANQTALANALMAQNNGMGPNPAQAMLNETTNQNIQNTAAQVASQRGISPGLAARLIAQQGAQTQQQAAGQGAAMRANQQVANQQQLAQLYGSQGAQNLTQQQTLQQALANQNNAVVGATNSSNQINASTAMGNANIMGGIVAGLGSAATKAAALNKGGPVPGKPEVAGDSPKNDKVPAMLSPGEIVIPRSKAKNSAKAKEFIDHLMGDKGEEDDIDYKDVLSSHRQMKDKIKKLEQRLSKMEA